MPPTAENSKPLPPELPYVCKATAAYGWNAAAGADVARGDLLFEAGATIELLSTKNPGEGWFTGRTSDGRTGTFPANYVIISQDVTQGRATQVMVESDFK